MNAEAPPYVSTKAKRTQQHPNSGAAPGSQQHLAPHVFVNPNAGVVPLAGVMPAVPIPVEGPPPLPTPATKLRAVAEPFQPKAFPTPPPAAPSSALPAAPNGQPAMGSKLGSIAAAPAPQVAPPPPPPPLPTVPPPGYLSPTKLQSNNNTGAAVTVGVVPLGLHHHHHHHHHIHHHQHHHHHLPQHVNPMPLPPGPPVAVAASVAESQKRLNVAAAPYTPTKERRSPSSRGSPSFPEGTAPPAPPIPVEGPVAVPAAQASVVSFSNEPSSTTSNNNLNNSNYSSSSPLTPASPPASPVVPVVAAAASCPSKDPFSKSLLQVPSVVRAPPAEAIKFNVMWSLWADDHPSQVLGEQKASQYQEPVLLRDVGDLETFWKLWWHIPPPSTCTPSWTYNWFRKDIRPAWEDPRNKNGGTITFVVFDHDKTGGLPKEVMDDVFLLLALGMSGESWSETSAINGVSLKIRPYRPVVAQLWTSTSDESRLRSAVAGLRTLVGRVLPAKQTSKLEFFSHSRMQQSQAPNAAASRFGKPKEKAKTADADFTF